MSILSPSPVARSPAARITGTFIEFGERTITWEYSHFLGRQQAGAERYAAFRKWNLAI